MRPARVRPLLPRILADLGDRPVALPRPSPNLRTPFRWRRTCRSALSPRTASTPLPSRPPPSCRTRTGSLPTVALRPPPHRRRLLERALVRASTDATPAAWAPLSGFWKASDGWVRTHGNYPHHAERLRDSVSACRSMPAPTSCASASRAIVGRRDRRRDHDGRAASPSSSADPNESGCPDRGDASPGRERRSSAAARRAPWHDGDSALGGIRVLDLTRVIAGPVATRTLALFGADVLRIDSPGLPEIGWQHLDTGAGKRSALLDLDGFVGSAPLRGPARATPTSWCSDTGPPRLRQAGTRPDAIAARHPGIVIGRLSAWGFVGVGCRSVGGSTASCRRHPGSRGSSRRTGSLPARSPPRPSTIRPATCWPPGIMSRLRRQRAEGGSHRGVGLAVPGAPRSC